MSEHDFCRGLLKVVRSDLTREQKQKLRGTWGYVFEGFNDHGEWHGPDGFYWHGSACCVYAARAHGIQAWLESVQS